LLTKLKWKALEGWFNGGLQKLFNLFAVFPLPFKRTFLISLREEIIIIYCFLIEKELLSKFSVSDTLLYYGGLI